ncbi:uncharacterized protein LOC117640559 isoform X2 [Thrips palmi]|nr:uncharacterized protein LOC117640559 isoform X2 [Thrips palmi]XP_034232989.1 uncharacterized protein LOC117640559 isoform X2 [Thrips palmi]XP_034232990.1 uncharacterized protein LOC117640559 isoform X2 [Thrips palmi]XP_034232992.1 uncharacterized protein LOC117640559 isoform X2 [Thrips palmi]XP_034232993.1 uncharacterized protein LOC117640559 isoform X2 [Thrips palmi]XP_034232994.1 uncharacterized protein LOC117640559 isoform X2 [Thrips palmi]XP_034232995.1 uncharacterized protein LOC11764
MDRCVYCCAKATVSCSRCGDEFYCSEKHLVQHRLVHSRACVRRKQEVSQIECQDQAETVTTCQNSLPLLPELVLHRICHRLGPADLVRLGWVCRSLRAVSRSSRAWTKVEFSGIEEPRTAKNTEQAVEGLNENGVLRIAPALHTLTLSLDTWPAVSLLRCTKNVKVLNLVWQEKPLEECDKSRLYHTLDHYSDHLIRVAVWVECLPDVETLRFFDGIKRIQELYIGNQLVKVYPGSQTGPVSYLSLGKWVSGDVAGDLIQACRETLTSFSVTASTWDHWSFESPTFDVGSELALCAGLQEVNLPPWRDIGILNSFPRLHTLGIDVPYFRYQHQSFDLFFETSPVVRRLRKLTLGMDSYAHRGIMQVVANNCPELRQLELDCHGSSSSPVSLLALPRDLHTILGRLGELTRLRIVEARVPSTVFKGIAQGALPNLTDLILQECSATEKGLSAMARLKVDREDLQVWEARQNVSKAVYNKNWAPERCSFSSCQDASDCDDSTSEEEEVDDDFAYGVIEKLRERYAF